MLSRCPHCDRPFVVADAQERPRCPHCGEDASDDAATAASPARPSEPRSAVTAEGSQPHVQAAPPGRRRHAVRPPPPRFEDGRPAWEQRDRSLLWRFFGTLADACLRPSAFFTNLSREGVPGITWFGYACLLLGTAGQAAWGLFSLPFIKSMLAQASASVEQAEKQAAGAEDSPIVSALLSVMQSSEGLLEQLSLVEAQLWATLLLAPLTAFFTIHLVAGLVHFSVQSFRPPDQEPVPYDVTYRFLLYAFAPMVLGVLPTLGGLAGLYAFALMLVAMARLHRVRVLGLTGGVLFPILLLSFLWDQEALPRLAPPLTEAVGIELVMQPEAKAADAAKDEAAVEPEGHDGSEYPPMPPADRDHSVEVKEHGGWLFSERTWDASFGRVHIRQLVAKSASASGERAMVLEVKNLGESDVERLFISHELPDGARLKGEEVKAGMNALGIDTSGIFIEKVIEERGLIVHYGRLPAGATAVIAFVVAGGTSERALLQTAPAVGRDAARAKGPSQDAEQSAP